MPAAHRCTSSSCACGSKPAGHSGRFARLGTAAVLMGAFPVAHALTPLLLRDAFPFCPFRLATGKPCPLCGLTRAIAMATHLRWHDAFRLNPLWPLVAGAMLCFSVLLVIDTITRRNLASRLAEALSKRSIPIVAGLVIFGIWRIARGS